MRPIFHGLLLVRLARLPQQWIEPAAGDPSIQLAAERLLAKARGLDQTGEIEAGVNAERLEQIGQILGADIAGIAATILYLGGMAVVGAWQNMGPLYYAGLAVAFGCAVYHGILIRNRGRDGCFKAFLHNHWLGLAVFAGIALDYAVRLSAWPRTL